MANGANSKPEDSSQKGFIADFIVGFSEWSVRWIPDSLVFVFALTFIVFFAAWGLTKHGPIELIDDYVKGFWVLLTFAMQMCVLMVTGFAVADSKPVKKAISALVDWPQTKTSVVLMYCFITAFLWWFHWGIGMMVAIIMGREIAVRKRGLGIHYPYLAAIAYVMIPIANGPSQAAQLLVATPGHFIEKVTGVIPLSKTSFDPLLLVTIVVLFITMPLVMLALMPKKDHSVEIDDATYATFVVPEVKDDPAKKYSPAERWDRSPVLQCGLGLIGLFWVGKFFVTKGISQMDLNTLNFTFLILAMLLHRTPKSFVASVQRGTSTVYGVILQFPLYAGIFGIISFSGLAGIIAHWFVSFSTPGTYPWIIFIYTGFLDMFVPSAGSKFVIEAPYIIPAAKELGVSIPHVINAYTFGSVWVNLLQPFWALPILAAFKVKFQDILPYTFIMLIWSFIVISASLLLFPNGF